MKLPSCLKNTINLVNKNYLKTNNLNNSLNLLKQQRIDPLECMKYFNQTKDIHKDDFSYENNYIKIKLSTFQNLEHYIIIWDENCLTKLHKHNNNCLMKIIDGNLNENKFNFISNKTEKNNYHNNDTTFIKKTEYHQIKNFNNLSMSLNIYEK